VFRQEDNFQTLHTIPFEPFLYDSKEQYRVECGKVKYKLQVEGETSMVPYWMTLGQASIEIDFSQNAKPGIWNMLLIAYLENYPERNIKTPFEVRQSSSQITCLPSTS
jgi:hypothetical protein